MRKFGTIIIALLIVVILVAIEIVIIKRAAKYEPQSEVLFAKVRIQEKTLITSDMLQLRKIGTGMVHKMAVCSLKDVIGRKAKMDIEAGEVILSAKLGYEGMERIEVKDKNKRLFSVEFKGDQANGWWLMPDQYVDIMFVPDEKAEHYNDSPGTNNENKQTISIEPFGSKIQKLKNIRIAALIDDGGKLLKNKDRVSLPRYISFEVTEEEANFLAYAKSNGRLEVCVVPE
jgi:Flp pilus assembly protein CpaB